MGQGAVGAFGLEGLQQALRQRAADQLAQRQAELTMQIQQHRMALDDQEAQRRAEEHAQTVADRQAALEERKQTATENEAAKLGSTLTPDQSIPDPVAQRLGGTMQAANMRMNPPLAQPPIAGMMQPDIVPGQQPGAVWAGTAEQRKTIEDEQKMEALANDPSTSPALKGFLRMRPLLPKGENIPYQLLTEPNGPRNPADTHATDRLFDIAHPLPEKPPPASYQLQPELDATGKQTGRFLGYNTKTNSWEPVKGAGPQSTKAAPGAAAANAEARTKTDTLDTLGQLDQAIENARSLIGPGAGQISNVEQMIGNADPRIQALGVKMKAAKMRVDHAITGSVRAGASPVLLQQWDNILANKITPEGLKAGVQAMRELVGPGDSSGGPVEHWTRDATGKLVKQ